MLRASPGAPPRGRHRRLGPRRGSPGRHRQDDRDRPRQPARRRAIGPDGAVYVANAGRGGKLCQGKGEDKFCLGLTSSVVKVASGKKSIVADGLFSAAGGGGVFATGVHGVSVAPNGRVFGVETSGTPKDIAARRRGRASRPAACST